MSDVPLPAPLLCRQQAKPWGCSGTLCCNTGHSPAQQGPWPGNQKVGVYLFGSGTGLPGKLRQGISSHLLPASQF